MASNIPTAFSQRKKALNLFRWTNKRYRGILIAYILLLSVSSPLMELIIKLKNRNIEEVANAAPVLIGTTFTLVAMIFSTVFAFVSFSYIHNKRCVDMFGSFPVDRATMLFTRLFSVIFQTVIPIFIVGLISAMMTFDLDGFLHVSRNVLFVAIAVVGNVAFISVVSLCCGTVVDTVVSYIAINGIYPVCVLICYLFPNSILPGYSVKSMNNYEIYTFLSPFLAPFAGAFGKHNLLYVLWWVGFSVALLIASYYLVKKRKVEVAQNSSIYIGLEQTIKVFAGFAVGFCFGWILVAISGKESTGLQFIWFTVGILIGTIATVIILHLIYNRSLADIRKSVLVIGIDIVFVLIFLISIARGGLGFDKRIPNEKDVEAVAVSMDSSSSFIVNGVNISEYYIKDKNAIEATLNAHRAVVKKVLEDKSIIYPIYGSKDVTFAEEGVDEITKDYYRLNISYKLKNGSYINRTYDGCFYGDEFDRLSKIVKKQNNIVGNLMKIPASYLSYVEIIDTVNDRSTGLDEFTEKGKKEIYEELRNAAKKDYDQMGEKFFSTKNMKWQLALSFIEDTYNGDDNQIYVTLNISKKHKNLYKFLIDNGYENIELINLKQEMHSGQDNNYGTMTGKEQRTVYFKVPKYWNNTKEIRAFLYDSDKFNFYTTSFSVKESKCERVKGNLWKYTYSLGSNMETGTLDKVFDKIMFCQVEENGVQTTGCVTLPKNREKKCLKLKNGKFGLNGDGIRDSLYNYKWEKLK